MEEEDKEDEKENPFPIKGKSEETILKTIEDAEEEDMSFSSQRIFGSMCSEPLELGKKVNAKFIEANLGNADLYRGTKRLEKRVHKAMESLIHFHRDDKKGSEVLSVGGGTEGNIIALWRARKSTGKRKVVMPKSAHFSFKKAVDLLDMEACYVSLDEEYRMDLSDLEKKVDDDTAMVVALAGSTELGQVDPIHNVASKIGDTYLHVDAAFGGMVLPFLDEKNKKEIPDFDFRVDGIDSMVIDPHKMGISPVPLGLYFSRGICDFSIDSPYLSGKSHKTIRGTRSSSPIPAFWATLNKLGKRGYEKMVSRCMENTEYLVDKMSAIGFESIIDPVMNIASFYHDEPEDVVKKMRDARYNISRTVTPKGLRFVVMPHVTKTSIDDVTELMKDFI